MTKYTYSEGPLEIYPPLDEHIQYMPPEKLEAIQKQITKRSRQLMEDMIIGSIDVYPSKYPSTACPECFRISGKHEPDCSHR